jgi:hypothetical protein
MTLLTYIFLSIIVLKDIYKRKFDLYVLMYIYTEYPC